MTRTAFSSGVLYNADCFDVFPHIPDGVVDMVLCDLPYGTTACKWDTVLPLDRLWVEYKRVCKPNAAIVLTASQPFTSVLVCSNLAMFKHEWIWHKSKSGSAFTAKYRPMAKHESVLVFGNGRTVYNPQMTDGEPYERTRRPPPINNHSFGLGINGESTTVNIGTRYPDSVVFFQQNWRRQDQVHPTQKPVALFEYLIKTYSHENDIILDNCIGSGTTAVAAINLKRRWIGVEKDENYYQIAKDRTQKAYRGETT